MAQVAPTVFEPSYTPVQQETNFLTFLGSFVPESPTTARAYYNAIDPQGKKPTFSQWLVNAGFISNVNQWHPNGAQNITSTLGVYGDNIINTDSHAIVLNAADLGFVRNQFIRCVPNCGAPNPIIYTYLENYPVQTANGVFGIDTTVPPTPAEIKAAIQLANTRPTSRIADVAFEWAPPPDGSSPRTRYGQLYSYLFHQDATGVITETRDWPNDPAFLNAKNGRTNTQFPPLFPLVAGEPFAPELDGRGFKQHPGVCFICHGGTPRNLTSTGAYPRQGNVDGFRLLPLDIANLGFTSDNDSGDPLSRAAQEAQIKKYNRVVLITTRGQTERDDQGVLRPPHLAEVIRGWYAGFDGDQSMSSPTQNTKFIPRGWRQSLGAPPGSEDLYLNAVAPSCRSCHFNRELSLDFGTEASFAADKSSILELSLLPECESNNPPPGKRPMPLARLTFDNFWQSVTTGPLQYQDQYVKSHFGFTPTSYCASNP
jgi:hypothetical protein